MMSNPKSSPSSSLKSFQEQYKLRPTAAGIKKAASPIQQPSNFHLFVKAGLPFLYSATSGEIDSEKDDMMEKLNKKWKKQDLDNTKRIERPEEILERRKKEREDRNKWHRRAWRWVTFQQ
ncbi:hypothetical protein QTG54_005434 [Skeletonema marinoi]|uniref:Uncharacterized protein n=1 Tax=Skeletonema marinoi TaxID=267567 RepID=A0AAD8YCW6_9STRA|nr:hypothetical protein QTG54_005434 [Skeletonema marinoi]